MIQGQQTFLDALIEFWCIRNGSINITGFYRAQVVDNIDPLKQNRVKVFIPELMNSVKGIWARPLYDFKKVAITPQVGDVVLVAFENGNLQQPVYIGHVRLSCPASQNKALCGTIEDKETETNQVPNDFWVLETPQYRRLRFNDYKQLIQLGSYHDKRYLEIDSQNQIIKIHSDQTGRLIEIDDKNNIIKIHGKDGQRIIHIDDQGQKIKLKTQKCTVELDDSSGKIHANIGNSTVDMTSNEIKATVGGSTIDMKPNMISARSNIIMLN